jgi:hypothetical protein
VLLCEGWVHAFIEKEECSKEEEARGKDREVARLSLSVA